MTLQYSTALRNNQVAQIQATVGPAGVLKIFSGGRPANCAAADPSGLLVTISLPAVFLTSAGGVTSLAGTWAGAAVAAGNAASFRVYDSGGACHAQGVITGPGGGGDLVLDDIAVSIGQPVSFASCAITGGNA